MSISPIRRAQHAQARSNSNTRPVSKAGQSNHPRQCPDPISRTRPASPLLTTLNATLATVRTALASLLAHETTAQRRNARLETPASTARALLLMMLVMMLRRRALLVVLRLLLGRGIAVLHLLGWRAVAAAAGQGSVVLGGVG